MNLKDLRFDSLSIPFRTSFAHHSAVRSTTQSLLVRCRTADGHNGIGEGCPREYVTGESVATALDFCRTWHDEFMGIQSLDQLQTWSLAHEDVIDANPAAWCAVELALLDALARSAGQTVEELLELPSLQDRHCYSAVLDDGSPQQFQRHLNTYHEMGFTDFKLKLSGDAKTDRDRLREVLTTVPDARLRVDGNNIWTDVDEAQTYLESLHTELFGVEEPLQAKDFVGMRQLQGPGKIILDESLLRACDLDEVASKPERFLANLRVSKLGGLLRSLRVAARAREMGIGIIVGAQVGETSVLTRAAMSLANACRDQLVAQEGAFGTLLLERDIVSPSLQFGRGGVLDPTECLDPDSLGWQLTEVGEY